MERCVGRIFAMAVCLLGLASCGGGGGSTGSTGNTGTETSNDPSLVVTADKSRLDFVGFDAVTTPIDPQTVNFTLTAGTGTYYGDVQADRPADFSARFTVSGPATAFVSLQPLRREPGTQSGSITFRLCNDANCNKVAWTKSIPYSVTVFSIDTTSLTLSGYEGSATAPATLKVSPTDTGRKLSLTPSLSSGSGWLSVSRAADSSITVTGDGAAVAPGSYQGKVRVTFTGQPDWPAVDVPVSFTVGDGLVAPAAATIELGLNSTKASMTATAQLDFKGTQAPSWTAGSDQPWLVLSQTSGKGSGPLEYSIDPSKTQDIANWSSATARVTISAPGLKDRSFPVTLNKRLPQIDAAWPNLMREGAGGTVRVSGRGLAQLAGIQQIRVGALNGITGSIASDTSATLTLPALPKGRTEISITNSAGLTTTAASISTALLSPSSAASAATTGDKRSSLFDPTRNAFFTINWRQNTLVRLTLVNGQWQLAGLPVTAIGDMAMAPDRRTLYVTSGEAKLLAVDPDTLQIRTSHVLPNTGLSGESLSTGSSRTRGLPVTSDQRIWFGNGYAYSLRYFDLLTESFGARQIDTYISLPIMSAPADGSAMWVNRQSVGAGYVYSPGSHTAKQAMDMPAIYYHAIFSEDGSRVVIDNDKLYKSADFSLIGALPRDNGFSTALLSPDGRRVYRPVMTAVNSYAVDHIDIYDATQVKPGSSELVKLGQIAVTAQATDCTPQQPGECDAVGSFTISPLGDTLFWVGNQALVVIPIPAGMSGLKATAGPRLLPAASR